MRYFHPFRCDHLSVHRAAMCASTAPRTALRHCHQRSQSRDVNTDSAARSTLEDGEELEDAWSCCLEQPGWSPPRRVKERRVDDLRDHLHFLFRHACGAARARLAPRDSWRRSTHPSARTSPRRCATAPTRRPCAPPSSTTVAARDSTTQSAHAGGGEAASQLWCSPSCRCERLHLLHRKGASECQGGEERG